MKAIFLAGLGFGDEGKGTITDYLTRKLGARLVVRYNGGFQAAHHVVLPDGRWHCFSQYGSGTLAGARTHLSRFMIVNPEHFRNETHALETLGVEAPSSLVTVSPHALVATPYHGILNRARERARGLGRHGSCGMGIGETVSMSIDHPALALRVGHLRNEGVALYYLQKIRDFVLAELLRLKGEGNATDAELGLSTEFRQADVVPRALDDARVFARTVRQAEDSGLPDMMRRAEVTIFEGAQGVLLDETHGFAPHTTWSDCTFWNAEKLVAPIRDDLELRKLGVLRCFQTRHGPGPMPTEDAACLPLLDGDHNQEGPFQGPMRAGHLDLVLTKYAIDVLGGIDGIALTHMDKMRGHGVTPCTHWNSEARLEFDGLRQAVQRRCGDAKAQTLVTMIRDTARFHSLFLRTIDTAIVIESDGPTHEDKWGTP